MIAFAFLEHAIRQDLEERTGEVVEVRCTYDPATRGGEAPHGRKVEGTIHWVSAPYALEAEVRSYEHLFLMPRSDQQPATATKSSGTATSASHLAW